MCIRDRISSPQSVIRNDYQQSALSVSYTHLGCGGSMRPEYYADLYRRYSTYCRNYDGNSLFKIASGASDYDYNWTKVLISCLLYTSRCV